MKIALVGSGNMANVLGKNLIQSDHNIRSVTARNQLEGKSLAKSLNSNFQELSVPIGEDIELVILCISDDNIGQVSSKIKLMNDETIVAHTSGSVSIDALQNDHKNIGVFYPLQTIRKQQFISFKQTPICINSNHPKVLSTLNNLAQTISKKIYILSDSERKKAHLAAVIVNNFTNHLVASAYEYLASQNIPFSIVQPLLEETMKKLLKTVPDTTQTGPAARNDQKTIEMHLEMLKDSEMKPLYKHLTNSILKKHHES